MAAANSPCGPPNCSSMRLAKPGLHSETRTVYCSRLLCMNIVELPFSVEEPRRCRTALGGDTESAAHRDHVVMMRAGCTVRAIAIVARCARHVGRSTRTGAPRVASAYRHTRAQRWADARAPWS